MKKAILWLSLFLTASILLQSFTFAACYKVEAIWEESLFPTSSINPDGIKMFLFIDSSNTDTPISSFLWNPDYEVQTGSTASCNEWRNTSTWLNRALLYQDFYLDQIHKNLIANTNITDAQKKTQLLERKKRRSIKYANYNFKDWLTRKQTFPLSMDDNTYKKLNMAPLRIEAISLWTAIGQYIFYYMMLWMAETMNNK